MPSDRLIRNLAAKHTLQNDRYDRLYWKCLSDGANRPCPLLRVPNAKNTSVPKTANHIDLQ